MIDIKHHGAVTGVTGSCHELVVGDSGILIDCGLLQGEEEDKTSAIMLTEPQPSERAVRIVDCAASAKESLKRQFHSVGLTGIMIPGLG